MENSCVNIEICSFPFGRHYNCRGVYIHYLYGFDDILRDATRIDRESGTVCFYLQGQRLYCTIPEIPHSGGLFRKYVSLQSINKSFINMGSRHTSKGISSSPWALLSFICLIAMLTSASEKMSVSMLGFFLTDRINWIVGCSRII